MASPKTASTWTCDRCEMTVSWSSGNKRRELPDNWVKTRKGIYCLACRREMAGEDALDKLPEDASDETRRKTNVAARVEFELGRAPDASDGQIAKTCKTSIASVRGARKRLGIAGGG